MKKLYSLAALLLLPVLSYATVYTLCNMPYCQPAAGLVFTTFDDAQNFANDGDIIYVQGSSFNYGSIYIYKKLTLIGAGHHPNKQNPLISSFLAIDVSNSDIKLIGLTFTRLFSYYPNVTVKKCRLTGDSGYSLMTLSNPNGWLIEGNILNAGNDYQPTINVGYSQANNLVIQNNIISSRGPKINGIYNNPSQRAYILNNIFMGDNNYSSVTSCLYVNVENNIFIDDYSPEYDLNNCVMNKNISFNCNDNNFLSPGINNLEGIDPVFVNVPPSPGFFDYNYDFRLDPSSPVHNAGTDGTDLGVFGGVGFKFTTTGEPAISEITALSITSGATVAPGGNITISLTSKSVH